MTNPYEAPQSDDAAAASGDETRRRPGLLLFAIVWPFCGHTWWIILSAAFRGVW